MKSISYSLIAAAAAVGLAYGADTATTKPVGYVSLGATGATAVPANTDVFLSIPLEKSAVYTGTVGSVSGSTVTLAGTPNFTANQFIATPHILKVESGAASGLTALISSNAAGSVVVTVQAGDSLAQLAANAQVSIRPAWTVKSLYAGNSLPNGTQLLLFDGVTPGTNLAPSISYTYASGANSWTNDGTFSSGDNDVLFSGETLILRNNSATPIASIVVSGEVPTSNYRNVSSKLAAGIAQDNAISFSSPVGETIGSAGLGVTSGDQILVYDNSIPGKNKAPSSTITFNGTTWTDDGTFSDVTQTLKLEGGKGYILRRAASAPVADTVISNQPDYVPGLNP